MVTINNSGVSEAINGEALDGSGCSAGGSRNEWRRGPGLSRENGHNHRSVRNRRAGRYQGSASYIGCLLLNAAIGIKPAMIPFTGTAVLNAMLGRSNRL
jgi:hypothetical protein